MSEAATVDETARNCLTCALRDKSHLVEPCWSCRRVDGADTNWMPRMPRLAPGAVTTHEAIAVSLASRLVGFMNGAVYGLRHGGSALQAADALEDEAARVQHEIDRLLGRPAAEPASPAASPGRRDEGDGAEPGRSE